MNATPKARQDAAARAASAMPPRAWRAARVTAVTELGQWSHLASTVVMVVTQLMLTWWLWRALYAGTATSAGLDVRQATTYALLGVLYMRFRFIGQWTNGDSMVRLIREGSIAYWFLRPVSPRRYYLIRCAGDLGYGAGWAAAGYLACRGLGLVSPPASWLAGLAAVIALAFGLVLTYYLQAVVDLLCFWTIVNGNAVTAVQFVQNLLSGAFAPLWFFPAWFQRADGWLPFQGTLNVPLSLYIGRLPLSEFGREVAIQATWCAALAVLTGLLWRKATARVVVQGG
jgi:ABC-2 type transport system permease protein